MPAMALREFVCLVCGQKFKSFTADMILPWDQICDDCMAAVWVYEGQALRQQVSLRMAGQPEERIEGIAQAIEYVRRETPDVGVLVQRRVWLRSMNAAKQGQV